MVAPTEFVMHDSGVIESGIFPNDEHRELTGTLIRAFPSNQTTTFARYDEDDDDNVDDSFD